MASHDVVDVSENIADRKTPKKKPPPMLKIDQDVVATGEKSPAPASVYDLFKKYRKSDEKSEERANDDKMNVGFDQMSTDEKSGFLRKLQMLTVGNKKSDSSAGRLLKKFVPSRRPTEEKPDKPRKQSARRLNFAPPDGVVKHEKNRVVAAMTREYEKLVTLKGGAPPAPVPINTGKSSRTHRGSLETPNDSPVSTPEKKPFDEPVAPGKRRVPSSRHTNNATWHGELPPRDYTSPTFSRKIFVGGVPWDITEAALKDSFGEFGSCAVEWPGQEARYRSGQSNLVPTNANLRSQSKYAGQAATGYVYMIFDDERAVAALLHECSQEIGGAGEWYFKIRAQRSKSTEIRQVQIIPWVTSDSLFCDDEYILETGIEPKRTVFVGALHGMMTAQVLHSIMEDCFGGVECVQLDTDKFKYPIGSGRVTFREHGAYFKAIEIGYLHVHTSKFRKRVQIDPFLESTSCMVCNAEPAHCFCRNRNCFKYYCHTCWAMDHNKETDVEVHVPVIVPSSASKAYPGPSRRHQQHGNSPAKLGLLTPAYPLIVGGRQTLASQYGYMPNNQRHASSYDGPVTPSPSESGSKNGGSRMDFSSAAAMYINTTPVMTPQKGASDSMVPSYFANSTAFLTPPPAYYGSPASHSSSNPMSPYYGTNLIYGYMPMAAYEMPSSSSYVCSPQNYPQ